MKRVRQGKEETPPFCSRYIIIDTHGGEQDMFALVSAIRLAKRHHKTIIGITCVNGRRDLQDAVEDVLRAQQIAGSSIPVYKGSKQSILLNTKYPDCYNFSEVNPKLKQITIRQQTKNLIQKQYAPIFISGQIIKLKQQLTIITLGPLTNLAIAFHRVKPLNKISSIYINGGAFSGVGNVISKCGAEGNFHYDSQAAHIVLSNFKNIFVNPIEMTLAISWSQIIKSLKQKESNNVLIDILLQKNNILCGGLLAILPVFLISTVKKIYNVYSEVMTQGNNIVGMMAPNWMRLQVKEGQQIPNTKIISQYDLQISQAILLEAFEKS